MIASDHVEAAVAGAAFAGRELAHTLISHKPICRIPRDAATTPSIYFHVLRVGFGMASEISFEERLLVDHIRGRVDHIAAVIRVDAAHDTTTRRCQSWAASVFSRSRPR